MSPPAGDVPLREDEIKFSLPGLDDHRKLVGPGGLPGFEGIDRQENIYLDTRDLRLALSRAMLRIRRASGRPAFLTLKRGTEVEAGYFRSTEIESEIPPGWVQGILDVPGSLFGLDLPPVQEVRRLFGEPDLRIIGRLDNERSRFNAGGLTIEVDRMTFPDGSQEFEVEVETGDPGAARAWLLGEFLRLGVRHEPGRWTKFERLLRRIGAPRSPVPDGF